MIAVALLFHFSLPLVLYLSGALCTIFAAMSLVGGGDTARPAPSQGNFCTFLHALQNTIVYLPTVLVHMESI